MVRLARATNGTPLLGDGRGFVPLSAAAPDLETIEDALRAAPDDLPDPSDACARPLSSDELSFTPPLSPGKLLGIGLNYVDHADDLSAESPDEPASFLKPASTVTGPGGPIRLPDPDVSGRVTAEAELALVFGRTCSNVSTEQVDDVVAGFLPVIDCTAEDVLQRNPRFLTRAKSFDTFLVLGPWIHVPASWPSLADTNVRTVINDEVVAENTVGNMVFPPKELVSFHSQVMTFETGDVLLTGTPGAGVVEPADEVRTEVTDVGSVTADVV